jgi:hypothetical protein
VYATVARVNSLPFQYFSTFLTKDLVTTKLDKETGIAEISMHNGAVNSLSLEMYVDTGFKRFVLYVVRSAELCLCIY